MVSVDGLLDGHEVAVRARVGELREEAARVAAALGEAELALEHVTITKATPAAVVAGHSLTFESRQEPEPGVPGAGRASVPAWRAGLDERALPVGYRPVWTVLVKDSETVRAKDVARALGFEPTVVKVEGARSRLQRLVRRGWAVESSPGAFRIAPGPAGTGRQPGRAGAVSRPVSARWENGRPPSRCRHSIPP